MAEPTEQEVIHYRFRLRRAKKATWVAKNDVLLDGELGVEKETGRAKLGPGPWNTLDYVNLGGLDLSHIEKGQFVVWDADQARFKASSMTGQVWAEFDATPNALEIAATRPITIPYDWEITGWRMESDGTPGSALVDVLKRDGFGGQQTSIVGANKVQVQNNIRASGSDLAGWDVVGLTHQQLVFRLDSVASFKALRVELELIKR